MAASIASSVGNVAGAAAKAIGSNFSSLAQDTATAAFPFLKGMSSFMKTEQTSTDYNKASDTVSNEGGFKLLDDSLSDIHQAIKMGNELLGGVREDVGEIRKLLQSIGASGGIGNGEKSSNGESLSEKVIETAVEVGMYNVIKRLLGVAALPAIAAGSMLYGDASGNAGVKAAMDKNKSTDSDENVIKYRAGVLFDVNNSAKKSKIDDSIAGKQQELNYTKSLEEQAMTAEEKVGFSKKEADLQKDINELLEQQKALLEQRNKAIADAVTQSQSIPTASSGSTGVGAAPTGSPRTVGSTYRRGNFGGAKPDLDDGTTQVLRRVGGASGADQNAFPAQSAADFIKSRGLNPNDFIHTPGILNNNIGNLKYKNIGWVGEVGPSKNLDEGSPQSVFSSPDDGMRAGMLNILNMYKGGKHTIEEIAAAYSPSNVEGAIKNFSQFTGYKKDEDLKLTDKDRLIHFFKGVAKQEQGDNSKLYGDDMYERGAERVLGLGKYGTNNADGNSSTPDMKSTKDVLDHLVEAKSRGLITNDQCVSLTAASVGIKLGGKSRDAWASNWVGAGNIDKNTAVGTPLITVTPDGRYAYGKGGTPGIKRDHGVNLIHADYDDKGNLKGMQVAEQYAGHKFDPNHPEKNTRYIKNTGLGNENDASMYRLAGVDDGKGGVHLLGGDKNPEQIRRDNLIRQKQTSSGPDYDKGLHDHSATYGGPMTGRDAYGRNNTAFPVPNDIPRMSRDMFMNQGDNTDLKNPLISKGIMPDKKDPLDTLLDQYQAHDNAKFKNMVGRKTDLAEFTKYDLYSNMKGRTSGPSTTNNIYGNHDNKENPLTPHKKKGNIPPVAPPDHVIHKMWTVKAPNGAYSGGGIGHM